VAQRSAVANCNAVARRRKANRTRVDEDDDVETLLTFKCCSSLRRQKCRSEPQWRALSWGLIARGGADGADIGA